MNYILLFGMPGGGELFFIVLIIIMLFGSKKIPELARGLGKGMREIKNATGDIQREIREGAKDFTDVKDSVNVEKQVKGMFKDEPKPEKKTVVEEENKEEEIVSQPQSVQRRSPYESEDSQSTPENL